MSRLVAVLRRWSSENNSEKGATMVEYGIMLAFIAAVVLVAVGPLGQAVSAFFTTVPGAF